MTVTPVLRFVDVHRHFGRQSVLRGLTFDVAPGQVYAFLGRNGAGKTTALRILMGFLAPHAGRAEVLGVDSATMPAAHRARIGYVGEGHRLYATMRVADAVAFEAGTRPTFRRSFADAAVERCGLRRGQIVGLLSRGQRAQLSLVLALASNPELLVFDDPAMGLDVVMRRMFLDAMIDLLADSGTSVLFSSHILTDVERIADRVGILHDGAMLVDATLDDLKQRVVRVDWTPDGERGDDALARLDADPRVLRVGRRREGVDLTLLDADATWLAALRAAGRLGTPVVPSLEDLFLDLTGPRQPGALADVAQLLASTGDAS